MGNSFECVTDGQFVALRVTINGVPHNIRLLDLQPDHPRHIVRLAASDIARFIDECTQGRTALLYAQPHTRFIKYRCGTLTVYRVCTIEATEPVMKSLLGALADYMIYLHKWHEPDRPALPVSAGTALALCNAIDAAVMRAADERNLPAADESAESIASDWVSIDCES
jgi:hypothetical protein